MVSVKDKHPYWFEALDLAPQKGQLPSPQLIVVKATAADDELLEKTLIQWEQFAENQEKASFFSSRDYRLFRASCLTIRAIQHSLKKENSLKEFHLCKNERGQIEGIILTMTTLNNRLLISRLATHPKNLRSVFNPSQSQVHYVGKRLLEAADLSAQKHKIYTLELFSMPLFFSFYEKCGYAFEGTKMIKHLSIRDF